MMALDSGHWYLPDGSPFYSVRSKDGTERGVTLRDARKVNAVPSVTTVLRILAQPGLDRWRREQVALAALTLPRVEGESSADLLRRIDRDAQQQAADAANEGTRIHAALEMAYKGGVYERRYHAHVEAVMDAVEAHFPNVKDWIAEQSFAHPSGFGGKVDLYSPSTGVIVDFKGKDGNFIEGKKLAYDQHEQLGGYSLGLDLPVAHCVNVFVSRTDPGAVAVYVWDPSDIAWARELFCRVLEVWKWKKKYESGTRESLSVRRA